MENKITLVCFYISEAHSQHFCFLRNADLENLSGEPKQAKLLDEGQGIMGWEAEKSHAGPTHQSQK